MKFNISVEDFVNYLSKLSFVIPTRSTLPILENILFELEGNNLRMHATDLESFIRALVKVDGVENGSVAIPAKKLLDLVRLLVSKYENVTISTGFDKNDYEALNAEINFSEILIEKINYDYASASFTFNGLLSVDEKTRMIDACKKINEGLSADSKNELSGLMLKLIDTIEELHRESEKVSTKIFSKKKIKIDANDKNKITITTANGKYSMYGENADDFPIPEEKSELNKFEIQGSTLKRFLGKVRHAASAEDIKRNMAGILFDIRRDDLRLVATDGFRLGKIMLKDFSHNNPKDDKFIVPLKAADLLFKLVEEGINTLEYDESSLKVTTGSVEIYSKLVDDTFPNYETVIPKNNDKKLKIKKSEFLNALKRASIFVDPATKRVKLEIKNFELFIRADNPESGAEGEEQIECEFISEGENINFDKEQFLISFNVTFLLDALNVSETEEIIISFSMPSKASIIIPTEQPNNEDFMELVMPVRVS